MNAKIYLAGPAVFLREPAKILAGMAKLVAAHGLIPVVPAIDIAIEPGTSSLQVAHRIREENFRRILASDGVLACLTPFRGALPDAGTVWEIGFAQALGKHVETWSETGAEVFLGFEMAAGLETAARRIAQRFG